MRVVHTNIFCIAETATASVILVMCPLGKAGLKPHFSLESLSLIPVQVALWRREEGRTTLIRFRFPTMSMNHCGLFGMVIPTDIKLAASRYTHMSFSLLYGSRDIFMRWKMTQCSWWICIPYWKYRDEKKRRTVFNIPHDIAPIPYHSFCHMIS